MSRRFLTALFLLSPVLYAQDAELGDASLDSLLQIPISSAAKHWQTIEEAPASVSIITSSQIERFGYRTLEEVFQSVRGFYISNDRNYTYLGVRGFGRPTDYNNRVLLLINGHTMNENVYGSSTFGTDFGLPLEMIDRIEIVRGPGSALYGTSAMFAVVNIVTKKGIVLDGFRATGSAGNNALYEGSLLWGKEYSNGLDVFFSANFSDGKGEDLYFSEFDTDSTNNGISSGLDWDRYWSFFSTMTYDEFTFQALTASREKGIPTAAWEMNFNDPAAQTLDIHQMLELQWNHALYTTSEVTVRGYYDRYRYEGEYPYDGLQHDGSIGTRAGTELRFRLDTSPNNRMTVGAEFQRHFRADYHNVYVDEVFFDKNFPFSIWSLYVQNEYQPVEYLSLTAGLRYDSYSTFGSTVNPRGAVIYYPMKGTTLKLLYGSAYRAPNVYEVYYEDPLSGQKPSSNIKPETIRTSEFVWEQRLTENLFGIISLYDYRMNNLIEQTIDPTDSLSQFQNVNSVRARGAEFELNFQLPSILRGFLSYAYQKTEGDPDGMMLTNSPEHVAKAGISYMLPYRFEASAEVFYETARKTVYDTQTDDNVLTNLSVRSPLILEKVQCSLTVKNAFDVNYKLPGGLEHAQDAIIQPGRTFLFKVGLKL